MNEKEYLRTEDVAALVGVSRRMVYKWREKYPDFPPPMKIDGTVRWEKSVIDEWMKSKTLAK